MVNHVTKWTFVNAPSSAFYDYQLNQGVTCRRQGGMRGGGYHIVHPLHPASARSQHVWWDVSCKFIRFFCLIKIVYPFPRLPLCNPHFGWKYKHPHYYQRLLKEGFQNVTNSIRGVPVPPPPGSSTDKIFWKKLAEMSLWKFVPKKAFLAQSFFEQLPPPPP